MIKGIKKLIYGIKSDKWMHAIVALVIVEVLFLAVFRCTGKPLGLLLSTAVILAVCALKELLDSVASWDDVIAGIAGTVIAGMVMTVS